MVVARSAIRPKSRHAFVTRAQSHRCSSPLMAFAASPTSRIGYARRHVMSAIAAAPFRGYGLAEALPGLRANQSALLLAARTPMS